MKHKAISKAEDYPFVLGFICGIVLSVVIGGAGAYWLIRSLLHTMKVL
jgi:hypothetical protein